MEQDNTWYGGRPQPRRHRVRWGPSFHPTQKRGTAASPPHFSAHVYCGQAAGWIRMPLGTEVGLGPAHIVLDGDPPKRGVEALPLFGPCLLWPNGRLSQQLMSSCSRYSELIRKFFISVYWRSRRCDSVGNFVKIFSVRKPRSPRLSSGFVSVILRFAVLTERRFVTDVPTDGYSDIAHTALAWRRAVKTVSKIAVVKMSRNQNTPADVITHVTHVTNDVM